MERLTNKRGREEGQDKVDCFAMKIAKTSSQDIFNQHHHQDSRRQEESGESYISSDDDHGKCVGLGVFDFPWLHDDGGMISKWDEEYWNFQDMFWWPPEAEVEYNRQCLYETPTTPPSVTLEAENGPEMDNLDCIWSWMLNQPLQQGHHA